MAKLFVILLLFFMQILNFNFVFASTKVRKRKEIQESPKAQKAAPTAPPSLSYDPRKEKPSQPAKDEASQEVIDKLSEEPAAEEKKPTKKIFGFFRRKKTTQNEQDERKKKKVFERAKQKAIETAKKFGAKFKKEAEQEGEFVKRVKAREAAEKEKAHEESGKMLAVLGQFRKMDKELDPEMFKREKEIFNQEFAYHTIKEAGVSREELDSFMLAKGRQNIAQADFEESQLKVDAERKALKKLKAEEELLSDEYDLLKLSKFDEDEESVYDLDKQSAILSDRIRSREKGLKEAEEFREFEKNQRDLTIESTTKDQEKVNAKLKKMDVEDEEVDEYVFGARAGYARRDEPGAEKKIEKLRKTVSDALVDLKELSDLESRRDDLSPKELKRLKTLSKRINKREKEIPKLYRKTEGLEEVKIEGIEGGLAASRGFMESGLGLKEKQIKLWPSQEGIKSELRDQPTVKEYWDKQMREEIAAEKE